MSVKSRKSSTIKYKVLFGFKKDDPELTGYFGCDNNIATELKFARWFPVKNEQHLSGFGTPEQWLNLVNDDEDLNHGFKFHLVNYTTKKAVD